MVLNRLFCSEYMLMPRVPKTVRCIAPWKLVICVDVTVKRSIRYAPIIVYNTGLALLL